MRHFNYLQAFLKTNKCILLLEQVFFSSGSFITTILLARSLGITQFGIYSSVILIFYLALSITSALIISPLQVLIASSSSKERHVGAALFFQLVIILMLCTISMTLLQLPFEPAIELKKMAPSILLFLCGFLMQDFFRRIFITLRQPLNALRITILLNLLLTAVIFIFSTQNRITIETALFLSGLSYIPSVVMGFILIQKKDVTIKSIKEHGVLHYKNGKWLLLTSFLQWWSNNALLAASGVFLGVQALGALRLSQSLFGILSALFQVFENYVTPQAAAIIQYSVPEMKTFITQLTKKSLFILVPVLLCVAFFARTIFQVSGGEEYSNYAFALQGMALLYLLLFIGYPVRIVIRVMMMNRDFFIAYCISFAFTITASPAIIKEWGLQGVIAALITNQLIMLGYWQWCLAKKQLTLWK